MNLSVDDRKLLPIVRWTAAVVALLVALVLPIAYFVIGYTHLEATLRTHSEMLAERVTDLVTNAPEVWMFEEHHLRSALGAHASHVRGMATLRGPRDEIIIEEGKPFASPALRRSLPLYESGQVVGQVEIGQSLRPLVNATAVAALLGLLLGGAAFSMLRILPLKALRRVTDELTEERERAEITLRSIGDAVITTDAASIVQFINSSAERLTGWSAEEARGRPVDDVLSLVDDHIRDPVADTLHRAIKGDGSTALEHGAKLARRDGRKIAIELSAAPIRHDNGAATGGVLVVRDVSATRDLTERLSWQATHDTLTGLVNRLEFDVRVGAALASARNSARQHAVCYMDLDQFKVVNDVCGHAAGDAMLKRLAAMLLLKIRMSDTLARLGGNEFGLLLENCSLDRAQIIAAELLVAISDHRFNWEDKSFNVGVSIGLVPVNAGSATSADILSAAETACYLAKEQGRGRVCVYQGAAGEVANRREEMGWIARINHAMRDNRLSLYYQQYLPKDATTPVTHIEVLLRLIDEEGNIVAPGNFLPAAERYNLMPSVDRWVIQTAFGRFKEIESRLGGPRLMCAINLSGTSVGVEGFLDFIVEQARAHAVPPESICFEITETAAINNLPKAGEFMKKARARDFRFALDDFGTGTNSFGYLKSLPIDYLKIDGGFVRDIMSDPISKAMTEAINHIGHVMGLKTVAEFAENEQIIGALKVIGVDFIQGYGVGKPAPLFGPAT